MKVTTTSVTQTANAILGKTETTLYYVIVENNIGKKHIIGVGKKTADAIQLLIETEGQESTLLIEQPKKEKEVKK